MTAILNTLCLMAIAIEISSAKWIVASTASSAQKIRRKTLDQKDAHARFEALLVEIEAARKHLQVPAGTRVLVAYEAGQEGFWLMRALRTAGIEAEVIDPVSLQVDRRARRVKTDRVDAEALAAALWRYLSGEQRALRMVQAPSALAEDDREWQRERERLTQQLRGCTDRISKKLRTQGIWPLPKSWRADLRNNRLREFSGGALCPMLGAVLRIELDRLEAAEAKLKELKGKLELLDSETRTCIERLVLVCGIGEVGSRALATQLYWRSFSNRRQVGSCVGLVGTPYDSGTMRQDQGISKAGDPKLRSLLIELAWSWLRYQPKSAISLWFAKRTEGGGKRNKRVMIVGVARKLAIALWRYLKDGLIPEGAALKRQVARA
jgi:transposase